MMSGAVPQGFHYSYNTELAPTAARATESGIITKIPKYTLDLVNLPSAKFCY